MKTGPYTKALPNYQIKKNVKVNVSPKKYVLDITNKIKNGLVPWASISKINKKSNEKLQK